MSLDLSRILEEFPYLQPKQESRPGRAVAYRLDLPVFPRGRSFAWAELRLGHGFPEHGRARIVLSPDAVLRVPHVESTGALCIDGDPGPRGLSPEDRLRLLLWRYQTLFLEPWLKGDLDGDFDSEPLNYWEIRVAQARSREDPVTEIWTVDDCPERPMVREGRLLLPGRIVVAAGEELPLTNRIVASLGPRATQRIRVRLADIPIAYPLTPQTWPQDQSELNSLLKGRLTSEQQMTFCHPIRNVARGEHRIVLLRNHEYGFAFLLPGGPPTVVARGKTTKAYPAPATPHPLSVTRIDPSWTVGRGQYPVVYQRQRLRLVVLGVGALGSPVVEHLARAGIGRIDLVDADVLSTANVGRHLLGVDDVGHPKAEAIARRLTLMHPATRIESFKVTGEAWLRDHALRQVDLVIDLTGEPDVRWSVEKARERHPCPLLIGWMEPYVAAAHACVLPAGSSWSKGVHDPMKDLQAVTWPEGVISREPGCSSRFQSYTAVAASHAVALIAEKALELADNPAQLPHITSWVRGQKYLDHHYRNLTLREWAQVAAAHDGMIIERPFI